MDLGNWSKTELESGKEVVNSGLEAGSGQQDSLEGRESNGFRADSLRTAVPPAAIGLCVGLLGGCQLTKRNSVARALGFGLLGGAIGFGASVAWENRRFASNAVQRVSRNVIRVRDERWMKKHSIAYA